METNESKQDYLEKILMFEEENKKIRAIDLANSFKYSRASISIALKKLSDEGLIVVDNNNYISLTSDGRNIANKVYERHVILTKLFEALGINNEIAKNDACKIEHDLSNETFNALKKLYFEKNKKS